MLAAKLALLVPLGVLAAAFSAFWSRELRTRVDARRKPSLVECAIGFLTDFLDTLGIGSFATTTALFRLRNLVSDRFLPGTMNVGHALPTVVQALIYIVIIEVDPLTLALLVAASAFGAYLGASRVSRWPMRAVQIGMGLSLMAAALLLLLRLVEWLPPGGDATGLYGWLLIAGVAGNVLLGALMTIGVGLYAPCMIMVSLLGMNPKAAFPIMMGSCAFLMPVASVRFVRARSYSPAAALGLTIGGIPGVLVAAYLVRELPLDALRWLVLVIAVYTAISLLRAARLPFEEVDDRLIERRP
jgi:uncharacterized membrane protein YfcA